MLDDDDTPMVFQIDTRNIVAGATDGSENPLTFRIPLRQRSDQSGIIRVSDGRADISVNSSTPSTAFNLTFATAGIYTITLFGKFVDFSFYNTVNMPYDRLKIILISQWSNVMILGTRFFYQCANLVIDAPNVLVLPVVPSWCFQQIKEIRSSLNLIDTTKATDMDRSVYFIATPLSSTFNPFFQSLNIVLQLYQDLTFTPAVNKIEIISNSVVTLSQPWNNIIFQNTGNIELICQTPNLTTMFRVIWNGEVRTRCHAGKIDVRNVTNTNQWLNSVMPQANVDATLLGWANLPFMQAGVTWNWNGSKYSNNAAVIAAYNKITVTWGVIFTGLTMA